MIIREAVINRPENIVIERHPNLAFNIPKGKPNAILENKVSINNNIQLGKIPYSVNI